jgi:hypothetical protein
MKPWEHKKTKIKLKKISGESALKIFFDLYFAGRKILKQSIIDANPKLKPQKIKALFNKHLTLAGDL